CRRSPPSTCSPYPTLFRSHGVDEEQMVLVRGFLELLDCRFDRAGHRVEVLGQLADLVVRLQLDALVIVAVGDLARSFGKSPHRRSEEHTSEVQSRVDVVCR